jgi:hypothetical protein
MSPTTFDKVISDQSTRMSTNDIKRDMEASEMMMRLKRITKTEAVCMMPY